VKPLVIWLSGLAVAFGLFAGVSAGTRDDEQVYVVVDSSFQMRPVWSRVPDELDRIDDRSDAEFALAIEKRSIHGFRSELTLVGVEPFAPCTFAGLADDPAAEAADERILITTAANTCDIEQFAGWTIIEL
jgi:hypothetical protein